MTLLTVSEIERLAKAGVKIEIGPIYPQSDPVTLMTTEPHRYGRTMMDAFWERWRRTRQHKDDGLAPPFQLFVTEQGDKVNVYVAPIGRDPVILTDESCLYPSDRLMASIALLERAK